MSADSACTLHTAAANAYNGTMSPIHNFFVRTAVKTSMYTLPTRAGFLESIGETGMTPMQQVVLCGRRAQSFADLMANDHVPRSCSAFRR